jgi:hypothetical protein
MKLQDQVISLFQAKRLKELGVYQESLFVHDEIPFELGTSQVRLRETATHDYSGNPAAFTVAELGLLLGISPYTVYLKTDNIMFWHADYEHMPFGAFATEAEAKAAILIHRLENNLIVNITEVNERLKS